MSAAADPDQVVASVLAEGRIDVEARVLPASNVTLVGRVTAGDESVRCVYKPVRGERPLWDFPDGTLAGREVAAYTVSEALGWGVVPLTIERDGPLGLGMVQLWCETVPGVRPVDVVPRGQVPEGFVDVLDARDEDDRPVSLVHENSPGLRRMALFDAVVNNADRKGGHVLAVDDGRRLGVDHGVCFHIDPKLRTVLWGWATLPLLDDEVAALTRLLERLHRAVDPLPTRLAGLISRREVGAITQRCEDLLTHRRMPLPGAKWPSIPWPAF